MTVGNREASPLADILPTLSGALSDAGAAVVVAPPGSGKTTVLPLFLLDSPWLRGRRILLIEPRRVAAKAAAAYMAACIGEEPGGTVGYSVRLESCTSASTRLEVITEGVMIRKIQADPELRDVGLLVFDEIHERSLGSDMALALCLDAHRALRPDLRLLAMSATLDGESVAELLGGGVPVIRGGIQPHPVEIRHLGGGALARSCAEDAVRGLRRAIDETSRDVLVFLPGVGEIRRVQSALNSCPWARPLSIHPLFADLSLARQAEVLSAPRSGPRRVVLATTIAQTSLTIEGVGAVVDTGWAKGPRYDPSNGLTRLVTQRISAASAAQRAGRAGRLGPGVCYRMWDPGTEASLRKMDDPEILNADLTPLVLELAVWGLNDPDALSWQTPPPSGAFAQAADLLRQLGALDTERRVTARGRDMAKLPLHPRLAHLLIESDRASRPLAADIAALLTERDILPEEDRAVVGSDLEERLRRLECWRDSGRPRGPKAAVDQERCRRVDLLSRRWAGMANAVREGSRGTGGSSIGALVALAYPDRIAKRRSERDGSYVLASGRAVRLGRDDLLRSAAYLAVASADAGRVDGRVFLAAQIPEDELGGILGDRIESCREVRWDSVREEVEAVEEGRFGALSLWCRRIANPDPEELRPVLLKGLRSKGLGVLSWTRETMQWRARVESLRLWQPEAGWPGMSDPELLGSLDRWLAPFLGREKSLEALSRLELGRILASLLDWDQKQRLEQLAPPTLRVPSGSTRPLSYSMDGAPPVLAVRLQELFGLRDSPRVCNGRVGVVLHLLSPAQRPIQITRDLAGFWERTYPEVRKELAGRYPKHYWPVDPWQAVATSATHKRHVERERHSG